MDTPYITYAEGIPPLLVKLIQRKNGSDTITMPPANRTKYKKWDEDRRFSLHRNPVLKIDSSGWPSQELLLDKGLDALRNTDLIPIGFDEYL
ncbi:MAG: hypothetical protein ACE5DM_02645 [Candidatus Nanoarchaeia archaeon]